VSSKIKDAHRNAPLAVLISFGIVICIATLYQALFYGVLGSTLALAADYPEAFPALLKVVFPNNPLLAHKIEGIIHLAIASSTLGAAYGILFSNSWNLHILAQHNHITKANWFTKLNRHFIPFACVLVEGILCFVYLAVSRGNKIPLQQIGAFGCVLAYTFSVAALMYAKKNNPQATTASWVPWLGLASCAILFTASIKSFWIDGMSSLIVYATLIALGVTMYVIKNRAESQGTNAF
jgi:amino acid transporter